MEWLKNLNQKMRDAREGRKKAAKEARLERIKVKCPFCKDTIPSNATKCSHCTADLTSKDARENIESQIKEKKKILIIGTSIVCGFFLMILVIVIGSISSSPQQSVKTQSVVSIGGEGVLRSSDDPSGTVFLATTPEALNQLTKTIIAKDAVGLLQLAIEGKAFGVTNGTRIKVIDSGVGTRGVRIVQGVNPVDQDKIGRSGWVPYEWVKPN
ncbi:MAG: hypothetical protein G01um101419_137 [Parcubacteria group bacterium Gr01-1014_19]|nr:MAG: hypothetical protein G01um101419_137 [Parcubacteria group bacterium Gr01-1014_19]